MSAEEKDKKKIVEPAAKKPEEKKEPHDWQKEAQANLEGWQRERANFANFLKQVERERQEVVLYATQALVARLVIVENYLDMALHQALANKNPALHEWLKGISQIQSELKGILKDEGVTEIKPQPGDAFDPHITEALATVATDKVAEGQVAELMEKGYRLHQRVIKPARVTVAAKYEERSTK